MPDELKDNIKGILRECPLAAGDYATEIEILANELSQLASLRGVANRPRGTQIAIETYLTKLRSSSRQMIRCFREIPSEAFLAMNLSGHDSKDFSRFCSR